MYVYLYVYVGSAHGVAEPCGNIMVDVIVFR